MSDPNEWHLTDDQREIRRLRRVLTETAKRAETAERRLQQADDDVSRYRRSAGGAHVDADRKVAEMQGHLNDVLGELVRRGVATDLVPDWWQTSELAAEAEMRAGWPEDIALAARCRDLVEELRKAELRIEREIARRRTEENSRDQWMSAAHAAGVGPDDGPRLVDPKIVVESYELSNAELRRRIDRADLAVATAERSVQTIADLVCLLPKLPVSPKRLHPGVLAALARIVAPSSGNQVALPPATVSEICRLAVENEVGNLGLHLNIIAGPGGKESDGRVQRAVESLRVRREAELGLTSTPEPDAPADLFSTLGGAL